jgi:hypothetical protein
MYALVIAGSELNEGDQFGDFAEFEEETLNEDHLQEIADALNEAWASVDGADVPLLSEKCQAQVRGGGLVVADWRSSPPKTIPIADTGPTKQVLESIVTELQRAELIRPNVGLHVVAMG